MRQKLVVPAVLVIAASFPWRARADVFGFNFIGPGVSGTINLTFSPAAADATYPAALEVTGISGTFTDTNNSLNIVNVPIGPLEPILHSAPEVTNLLAPKDFSKFAVNSGLPAQNNGFLTYDNLYWPGGSPPTASDYPVHGGFLDIYGLMFDIGNGQVVDFWSNGIFAPGTPPDYGVGVATRDMALDYVGGGVTATPEPGELGLLGVGLLGVLAWRRRATLRKTA